MSEKTERRSVLKGACAIFPAAVLAGCPIGGSGAYEATVRNGTEERLDVSVQVTEDGSTVIDTTLTLDPAETSELEQSQSTFKQEKTYTIEVDAGGDRQDTYEYEADDPLEIVARSDDIAFLIRKG
ncbi:hypothetical protein BRC85_09585 [Halobacteriales archaeon QS_1_69_70]|nr:MAG: hypothetical protein BRC85_09585 [Halobacteriales archaeon QS_1_69_70]